MSLSLKPTHASVKAYYDTLHEFGQLYIDHESAVLHHPKYRERYAANLRRELPRIPFVGMTPNACHPEVPSFGAEGSLYPDGATDTTGESRDPSARQKRGPSG